MSRMIGCERRLLLSLTALALFACSGNAERESDECGLGRSCLPGFSCDERSGRCLRWSDGGSAAVDGHVEVAAADAAVEAPVDAAAEIEIEIDTTIVSGPAALTRHPSAELGFASN